MQSKADKSGGDENLALFGQAKKRKGKGPDKGKGKSEKSTSQSGKKDLSKIKCFIFHKREHYATQCLNRKKGIGKKQQQQQVASFAETQMNEFVTKFENDFSMISCLSTNVVLRDAWHVDGEASQHMTSIQQFFSSLKKLDSRVQVELGDNVKYLVAGVGPIRFHLESSNTLDFDDVLFILGLRKNLFYGG